MSNEEFYDSEIAPKLAALAKACQDRGMSFVASVEYDAPNGGRGRTDFMMPDELDKLSCAQRLVHWAARCNGNIDSFLLACDKHGKKYGHSSIYLYQAGNKNIKYGDNEFAALTVRYPESGMVGG